MFTGLVEEVGEICGIQQGVKSCVFKIKCHEVLQGTKVGDSIAVNGVCLTVTSLGKEYYTADVMPESIRRSGLGKLRHGARVNLERAMPANGRFGGHIVSGHIDGVGEIQSVVVEDNAVIYTIAADTPILKYIVEKGSVTVDGISLTVVSVDEQYFQVSTIPHTRDVTNLSDRKSGDTVNLECDVIGKYVEKLLGFQTEPKKETTITEAFLREHGF